MSEPIPPENGGQGLKRRKVGSSSSLVSFSSRSDCVCVGSPPCICSTSKEKAPAPSKFACPYYRRYPDQKPSSTSCAYPGFPTIFRVKEHLYKKHRALDWKCSRCQEIFDTEDALQDHQRALDVCEIRQAPRPTGFSKDQERQLRSRKRSPRCMSEEEKWLEVYQILFPQDTDKPTPYVEGGSTSVLDFRRYREFSRRVLRHVLVHELRFFDRLRYASSNPRSETDIVDVVMKCQEQVFQKFVDDNTADAGIQTPGTFGQDAIELSVKPPTSCSSTVGNDLEMDMESWAQNTIDETISSRGIEDYNMISNDINQLNSDNRSDMATSPFVDVSGISVEGIGEDGLFDGLNFDPDFFTF